jgi:hypothetical protein
MLKGDSTRHLTFDMSGRPQTAKLAVGCPLDGEVRCRATHVAWALPHSAAQPFGFASLARWLATSRRPPQEGAVR